MPESSRIERVSGRALPLRSCDIDTDRIIPARFLKAVTFAGLEAHVFEDERTAHREKDATHPFDVTDYQGASILIVSSNFGCGSSREHAPQAILRWGIRAIVGESFAEIFFGNALAIGLPCLTASHADVKRLLDLVEVEPARTFDIDLRTNQLSSGAITIPLGLPTSARASLLSGDWDATSLLLANADEVQRTAARLPYPHFHG